MGPSHRINVLKMADPPPITVEELVKKAGLPSQCLREEFREEHIHILAKFCDPWENIGYHLKLTQGDINVIEGDNATTEKKRIATLRKWKEKFAHKATYHVLIEALIQSDHAQQGLNLCRKLNLCLCRELKVEILVDEQLAANLDQKSSDSSQPLTEQSRAGSQNIPSEVVPDTNMCIAQSIHELQMRFVCIQNRFLQSGAGTGVTLQQLQTCISTLPSFTTDTPQKLLEATSVQLFIYNLKEYCCALNPDILEGLIEVLGDRDTKLMMKQYNQDLHNFRCKTKLKDFIGNYDGPAPPGYKEIKLKLGDNWEEKTLADATLICSQISRRSWLVKMISKHSVHVTLLTPRVDDIEIGLHLGDYLRSQRVLQILVCGVCIFDVKGIVYWLIF